MALAVTEAELQRILDNVAFTRSYGFRLQAIGEGECTLEVPFRTDFERPGGIGRGQPRAVSLHRADREARTAARLRRRREHGCRGPTARPPLPDVRPRLGLGTRHVADSQEMVS